MQPSFTISLLYAVIRYDYIALLRNFFLSRHFHTESVTVEAFCMGFMLMCVSSVCPSHISLLTDFFTSSFQPCRNVLI